MKRFSGRFSQILHKVVSAFNVVSSRIPIRTIVKKPLPSWGLAAMVILAAAAWKLLFILWDVVPFNADEAVVALMARHILNGAHPIFFYGQAYMGSLDAYLVAAGFAIFGQQVWVIRVVQGLLYLGTVATTILLGKAAFDSLPVGLLAGLLLAFPAVNVVLYTTASLGGYGEALLIGNLILLLSVWIGRCGLPGRHPRLLWACLGWGALAGCGLWANGLTLVYTAPAGIYLVSTAWKAVFQTEGALKVKVAFTLKVASTLVLGFILGALPWWIYAFEHGPALLVQELLGQAVAVETEPWLVRTGAHVVNFILLGATALFGFRPPWKVEWLALPLLPFLLVFWMGALAHFERSLRVGKSHRAEYALLAGVLATLTAGFLFTSFGVDPSGRYFLPMAAPLALVAASMILSVHRFTAQPYLLVLLVVSAHIWGTLQCAFQFPPGLTTQFYEPSIIDHRADGELIRFLKQEGETRGYSNYWVAYPLAFLSQEELVFVPRLPYHDSNSLPQELIYTPRDDRYRPYTEMVEQSQRVAYITTRAPGLDRYLVEQFTALGINWQEKQIGDFHVFYRLSEVVRPQQMGLGEARE